MSLQTSNRISSNPSRMTARYNVSFHDILASRADLYVKLVVFTNQRIEEQMPICLWFEQHDIDREDHIVKLNVLVGKV